MNTALRFHIHSLKQQVWTDLSNLNLQANQKQGDYTWVLPVLEFLVQSFSA